MEAHTEPNDRQQVGRYHLVERLAVGGMAEVFLATERGPHALDRLVVIKRILPHLAEDEAFVEMFLAEARIAARIAHPNVVEIHELGESGGYPFIAMEYVPGSTLKQLVRAARDRNLLLPSDVVVHLISQACAGAHAAHELRDPHGAPAELVHRDLTPHNLMVTDRALVKLLDFGIAKASSSADHTRTGMLKGKISYMSPEQCRQERLDRRSDIFALGICAWELLAGYKPFSGKSELATMQAIVTGNLPHLREVRPDVPEPVAEAIHRALAVDIDQRYATADDMRRELREAARVAGCTPDEDQAVTLVRELLGASHDDRKRHVDAALERTLVTLSAVSPAHPNHLDPQTEESGRPGTTRSRPAHTPDSGAPSAPSAAAAGIALSVGVLGLGGLVLLGIAGGAAAWWFGLFGPPAPPTGEPILVVMPTTLDAAVLKAEHEPIRLYLERVVDRPVQLEVAPGYEAAAVRLVDGSVPYGILPHNTIMHANARGEVLHPLANKIVDGSSSTDGYLVVARDNPAKTIADLEGQTICYSDVWSHTGYELPRTFIRDAGLDPDADFVPRVSGNHPQVLRDLVAGDCAVGGTYSVNYNSADQLGIPTARLRILAITGTTPHDAFVAGPAADPALSKAITEALLAFDPARDAGVPLVGESERISGFSPPAPTIDGRPAPEGKP